MHEKCNDLFRRNRCRSLLLEIDSRKSFVSKKKKKKRNFVRFSISSRIEGKTSERVSGGIVSRKRGRKVKTPWWPRLLKNRGKKTGSSRADNTRLSRPLSNRLTAEFFQHGPHGWLPWYPEVSFRAMLYTAIPPLAPSKTANNRVTMAERRNRLILRIYQAAPILDIIILDIGGIFQLKCRLGY